MRRSLTQKGDFSSGILDLMWLKEFQRFTGFILWNGSERRMVAQGYASYLGGFQPTFGNQETHDVATRDFFFFPYIEI